MSDPEIAVRPAPLPFLLLGLLSMPVSAQSLAPPDWTASTPIGASIDLGLRAMAVDPGGVTFVTADSGTSSDVDVLTAAFAADGSLSWQQVFDGPFSSHDQVRAMALGLGGIVWLTGNTANGVNVANVLLLGYEPTTGAQLQATLVPAAASESGASIAVDDVGNLYVAGHSGPDVLLIKFDPLGSLLWRKLWDGPAGGPFSLDRGLQVLIGPTGDPVVLAQGVMGGSLPDYVVLRFAAANGALQWVSNWGTTAAEYAHAMALDDVGDVYATGLAMDGVVQKFATIKLDGATGALLWQAFDHDGSGNSPAVRGICVDRRGGVYVTGSLDPDGNQSNHNDDFFTVRRDATSGALTWMHAFGASCIDCLDLPEDLAVDAAGNLLVVGSSNSPPQQHAQLVLALDAATGAQLGLQAQSVGGNPLLGAAWVRFDAAQNALVAGMSRVDPSQQASVLVTRFPTMPTARPFGSGCAGSSPQPLTLVANSAPVLPNAGFELDLLGGPVAALQAIAFALEPAAWPLPFGDPGCFVHLDAASWIGIFVVPFGGLPLPLPPQPALRGARVVAQGVAFPVGSGMVTSNGLELQLGN